jgi:hypothetical protein
MHDDQNFTRHRVAAPPSAIPKWSAEVLDEGFVPFPKRLLRCLNRLAVNAEELQVILAVADYARPNLTRMPSYEFLAFTAGLTTDEFRRAAEALENRGLVEIVERGDSVSVRLDNLLALVGNITEDESRPEELFPRS